MLLNILDLEKVQVDQIMVPRNEVSGLDIEDDMEEMLEQIASAQHTRLPVYRKDIDNIVGVLHMRSAGRLIKTENLNKAAIFRKPRNLTLFRTARHYIPSCSISRVKNCDWR